MRKFIVASLFAVMATQALAEDTSLRSSIVSISAEEIGNGKAGKKLRHRLAMAIEEVCGSYASASDWQVAEIDRCRKAAWNDANRQVAQLQSERILAARGR